MNEIITIPYHCAYCGEENEALVDPSGGPAQRYTEDCSVCCRPNVLQISIDFQGNIRLEAIFEG